MENKEEKIMKFEIYPDQIKKMDEWKEKIKGLYGEYGHYSYTFFPTGIGNGVTVKSHLTGLELDLTDVDTW
jgi:hypothetical protein